MKRKGERVLIIIYEPNTARRRFVFYTRTYILVQYIVGCPLGRIKCLYEQDLPLAEWTEQSPGNKVKTDERFIFLFFFPFSKPVAIFYTELREHECFSE